MTTIQIEIDGGGLVDATAIIKLMARDMQRGDFAVSLDALLVRQFAVLQSMGAISESVAMDLCFVAAGLLAAKYDAEGGSSSESFAMPAHQGGLQ